MSKRKVWFLGGILLFAVLAGVLAFRPYSVSAKEYKPVDVSKLDSAGQYWAGRTGYQYRSYLYFVRNGSIVRYSNAMAENGEEPEVFKENVWQRAYDSNKLFVRKNIMLYVTTDYELHLANLLKNTDKVISKDIESVIYFNGKTIVYNPKGSSKVKFLSTAGKRRKAPEWGAKYTENLPKYQFDFSDGRYRLQVSWKKDSTLYRIEGDKEVKVASKDLTFLRYSEAYSIYSKGDYIILVDMGDCWDCLHVYNKELQELFREGYDEATYSCRDIIGDMLYVYESVEGGEAYFEDWEDLEDEDIPSSEGWAYENRPDWNGEIVEDYCRYRIFDLAAIAAEIDKKEAEGDGSGKTGAEDTKAEDTKAEDTAAEDTDAEDTKAEDTDAEDTKAEDTDAEDTKAEETKAEDTDAEDTKAEETEAVGAPLLVLEFSDGSSAEWRTGDSAIDISGKKLKYVYTGAYPQAEITGEQLTDEIKNADYDEYGFASVGEIRYKRLAKEDASYVMKTSTGLGTVHYNWRKKDFAYFTVEPVKWRVLSLEGGNVFLMSEKALDSAPVDTDNNCDLWEKSSLRQWLNNDFIRDAFSEDVKAMIVPTQLAQTKKTKAEFGNEVLEDMVTLLTMKDTTKTEYGFADSRDVKDKKRRCPFTGYAFARGVRNYEYEDDVPMEKFSAGWWLRTPAKYNSFVCVYSSGKTHYSGTFTTTSYYSVRPVMHFDLSSVISE